jgi:hypothetical protein
MATTDGPATLEQLKELLKIADDSQDAELSRVLAAVNEYVAGLPVAQPNPTDPAPWPARTVQGAGMLAARLHRRKGSPAGVEAFGELGAVYVQRNDPDIAWLLKLGRYQFPLVG